MARNTKQEVMFMRINKTQYAILGALSIQTMSGYDIKKWLLEVTGSFWAESPGQIYPTLSKLLADGLVKCNEEQTKGKRPRKVYSITKKGSNVLKTWLQLPAESPTIRNELRLKLFFGNNMSKEDCIAHLESRKHRANENLIRYKSIQKHIKDQHKKDENSFYWLLTLKSAIMHEQAELNWCEKSVKTLKRKRGK